MTNLLHSLGYGIGAMCSFYLVVVIPLRPQISEKTQKDLDEMSAGIALSIIFITL